jgi:hypothetical protein
MTVLLDAAGRRRSPATLPGYHTGRPPRNKGIRYPADPPTVEEIVVVMRHAADDRHGRRLGAMIVVLWRAGLRIQEALALGDLDPGAGRCSSAMGRAAGAERSAWTTGAGSTCAHGSANAPGCPSGRCSASSTAPPAAALVGRRGPQRAPAPRCDCGRPASVRAAPAAPRARARAGARGRAAQHHPVASSGIETSARRRSTCRDRSRGDHRRRVRPTRADDVRQRRTQALTWAMACTSGSPHVALPLIPGEASAWTRATESSGARPPGSATTGRHLSTAPMRTSH